MLNFSSFRNKTCRQTHYFTSVCSFYAICAKNTQCNMQVSQCTHTHTHTHTHTRRCMLPARWHTLTDFTSMCTDHYVI